MSAEAEFIPGVNQTAAGRERAFVNVCRSMAFIASQDATGSSANNRLSSFMRASGRRSSRIFVCVVESDGRDALIAPRLAAHLPRLIEDLHLRGPRRSRDRR